jgi:hypothetical protein
LDWIEGRFCFSGLSAADAADDTHEAAAAIKIKTHCARISNSETEMHRDRDDPL